MSTTSKRHYKDSANAKLRFEHLEDRRVLASFTGLGDLTGGEFFSRAMGVSDDGQVVVGDSQGASGFGEGFRWTASEGMVALAPGLESAGRKASANGSVIVGRGGSTNDLGALVWDSGIMFDIDPGQDAGFHGAYDVTADGQLVVGVGKDELRDDLNQDEAYIHNRGDDSTVVLGPRPGDSPETVALAISENRFVVGFGVDSERDFQIPLRWSVGQDGTVSVEAIGTRGHARDVSADGSVVVGMEHVVDSIKKRGKRQIYETHAEAFVWSNRSGSPEVQRLGDLPGGEVNSYAFAVSSDGTLVAGSGRSEDGTEAFVWDATNGMRSLQDVLAADYGLDLTGWQLTRVWDMSADGMTLVGEGINPAGNTEGFVVTLDPPDPGISVSPATGLETTEGGGTAAFEVVLTAAPTSDVIISVSSTDASEGQIVGADEVTGVLTLTFNDTNWNVPQQVTVQGVEDLGEQDGNQPYSIRLDPAASVDPNYASLSVVDVSATNLDNDNPVPSNTIYVYNILDAFDTRQRGRNNTDHRIVVDVRQDDNGIAEASDLGIGGVQVTVELRDANGSLVGTYTGTTDSSGIFYSDWIKGLSPGDYRAEVTELALANFAWDPFDVLDATNNDEDWDSDGTPDDLLTL